MTSGPYRIRVASGDGHERLQHITAQDTLWRFRGVIGHEAIDEGKRRLRDRHAGERLVGELRVL